MYDRISYPSYLPHARYGGIAVEEDKLLKYDDRYCIIDSTAILPHPTFVCFFY